jgi:hypothetical protein
MIPAFVTYKGLEKEDFLNQLALTEHRELSLYNLLCSYTLRTGKSDIDVKEFISIVHFWAKERDEPGFAGTKALDALSILLEKLETGGFAIVEREGKRPMVFHLIDQEMTEGLDERVAEEINKNYVEIEYHLQNPFPSKRDFEIPSRLVKDIDYREFTAEAITKNAQWGGVISVTFSDSVDIVCLPDRLEQLLKLSYRKIHFYLVNNTELFDHVYLELRKILAAKKELGRKQFFEYLEGETEADPMFWVYLSLVITKSKEKASQLQKMAAGNISFYQSATLLYHYWRQEVEAERKVKSREADVKLILKEIGSKAKLYSPEELGQLKDPGGHAFGSKYEHFDQFLSGLIKDYESETQGESPSEMEMGLPEIVEIEGSFIHRDAILPLFLDCLKRASGYLKNHFSECWQEDLMLRSSSDKSMCSDEEFTKAIRKKIQREFPSLYRLLYSPDVVYASIAGRIESDRNLMRYQELLFESLDEPRFRELDRILSLDREKMLNDLLSQYSFIQRFLIRRRLRRRRREGSLLLLPMDERARLKTAPRRKPLAQKPTEAKRSESEQARAQRQKQRKMPATGKEEARVQGDKKTRQQPFDKGRMDDAVEELRKAMSRKQG